ncbi:Pkinase-domain-containing protein [Hesseltinella vesiculosa]|uniref:Pkinase-domain-containing protein n=1 Tax=Hesseltinella vesiculosa TaxID=101127 RepID=A0A1X2GQM3_9FUNG|nr:Pkinase-domain-containing protein [Hesseltinella vesiculosa]
MSVFSKFTKLLGQAKSSLGGDKYETVARIVEEERIAKQHLPAYTGLERYQLLEKIGDGAFSVVYRAIDTETNEKVAVKVVDHSKLKRDQKASVLKEISLMQKLNHPSIVRMLSYRETSTHFFLVLELCDGGELFNQIVKLTYFSEDLARHCIRQVAEGLRYLHEECGIVHRDIKPENLLFDSIPFMERTSPAPPLPDFDDESKLDEGELVPGLGGGGIGKVKIADFGLSKVVWDKTTMTPCGTVGYTAPEIVKDQRYSKSVDMFALGCVLYTMLCGFPPFYDEDIADLTQKVAKCQYEFLSPWWDVISDGAKDLISHTLCMNPRKRYTIQQFLDHPWMQQQEKKQLSSEPVTDSDAEQFKLKYQRGYRSAPTTPSTERRLVLEPGMKEIYDVTMDMARGQEEKKLKKRAKRHPQDFAQALHMSQFPDDEHDDDDLDADTDEDDDTTSNDDNDSSSSAPSTSDNATALDPEMEALTSQLDQFMSADQQESAAQTIRQVQAVADDPTLQQEPLKKVKTRKPQPVFELKMDGATLLEKRRKHQISQPQ